MKKTEIPTFKKMHVSDFMIQNYWTGENVSRAIGVAQSTIYNWKNGRQVQPEWCEILLGFIDEKLNESKEEKKPVGRPRKENAPLKPWCPIHPDLPVHEHLDNKCPLCWTLDRDAEKAARGESW